MERYERGDLTFDVVDRGPHDAPTVVLLHGWPADASCWEGVAPLLADRGLRTLAPNQRGVSAGARPLRRRDYVLTELVADVLALVEAADVERFHLVGHDWGGGVAWAFAAEHPERLASLTVLSTPHPQAMQQAMVRSTQLLQSWYMLFFQLPVVPERLLLARGGAVGRRVLERSGLPAAPAAAYLAAKAEPDAMTASLHWYRALPLGGRATAAIHSGPTVVPTSYIWSTGDAALGRRAAELTAEHVTGPYRFTVLEGVSHWIPEVEPARTAELIAEQVAAHS